MVSRLIASKFASFALAAGALAATSPAQAETISVVSFGGAYENAMKEAFFKPYTAQKSNIDFNYESYDGGLAKLSAMVQAKNTTWDLMDMEEQDMIAACDEGMLQPFDKSLLGDASDFLPGTIAKCGVATAMWTSVFAYDTTKLATAPTTIADFFDTRKFPGKRGMRKTATLTLEAALLADGVPTTDVYKVLGTPEGLDRAFKKLDSIKSDIVWWEAGSQPPQLL
ncbi:MAG TPA: extracellular solute-binding protein, partial [Bordetella sp.]